MNFYDVPVVGYFKTDSSPTQMFRSGTCKKRKKGFRLDINNLNCNNNYNYGFYTKL